MTVRDIILFAILLAAGTLSFCYHHARSHRHLGALRAREQQVAHEVGSLRHRHRDLRAEAVALRTDHYYVERTLRAQHGWRPPRRPAEAAPSVDVPALAESGQELASVVPPLPSTVPRPSGPPQPVQPSPPHVQPSAPQPPQPPADPDRELLVALGYTSVAHFQCKMMQGRASGALDEPTRLRARRMAALLRRVGCTSVGQFQRASGLTVDGIYGCRTEQAMIRVLRRARGIVVESGRSGGRDGG